MHRRRGQATWLGLPLFIDRFVQVNDRVNNITQQALFSDVLGLQGCAALGLLELPSPSPSPRAARPPRPPTLLSPPRPPHHLPAWQGVCCFPGTAICLSACLLGRLALLG